MTRVERLRIEHLGGDVLGTTETRPRLSWWLPADAGTQISYEIRTDDGRNAEVASDRHVLVPWPFEPLAARQAVRVEVRVRTDLGPSDWSEPATLEVGLLQRSDWQAAWIEPDEGPERPPPGQRPAWLLRHEFDLDAAAAGPARLYATAHGIYETFLNGRRVGDLELTPGFTDYASSLHVQTYDVTELLRPGTNVWDVTLSDGWYRGRHGNSQLADGFGSAVGFLGQLETGTAVVVTGPGWEATTGPIVAADLMAGQVEDHRIAPGPWRPVCTTDRGLDQLSSSPAPPVTHVEDVRPVHVHDVGGGRQVIDLGQNITGHLRLHRLGPPGTTTRLLHGEAVDDDGDVTTRHLGFGEDDRRDQLDQVTSAGGAEETFEPRHTVHGFQYARVEGSPDRLTVDDATGVVVHTDLVRTGWFGCSDERVNRLHEIADWSFRDNACDIPTDCPHRERSGWTGDWQLFVPSAAYLYDVAGFSVKWLRDLAAEQLPDGLLPNYAPDPRRRRAVAEADLTWYGLLGSAGWGDACVLVPWELYRHYGDEQILEEMWPTMLRWLDYAATAARTRRHPSRSERPPLPHEEHLWDGGWHWGEWCEPETDGAPWFAADQGHVATAYLHHTASIAARIGRLLGRDVTALDDLAAGALDAWRAEYLADDGAIRPDTQANHVRALAFGLVPDDLRDRTAGRLVALIRDADTHLGTGFLATPYLLPALADSGHLDVAYELLLRDTPPSWLTMVDRGATTVWEEWEGIDEHGVAHASLNHYSKGAVISFLHRYVAGIQLDEHIAYDHLRIAPRPGGGLTWAEGQLDSPHGRIESKWRIADGAFQLHVTVPPGTTAVVELPDGTSSTVGPGQTTHTCEAPDPRRGQLRQPTTSNRGREPR